MKASSFSPFLPCPIGFTRYGLIIHLLIHAFAHSLIAQSRSSTQTQINNLLPTNGSRQINAAILRLAFNATLNYTDTKTGIVGPQGPKGDRGENATATIYQSNFAANLDNANLWVNGSSTFTRYNGQLIVSSVDDAVGFGNPALYRENQLINVYVDFVKTGSDVVVVPCYGGTNSSYTLTATGRYYFQLKRTYTYPIPDYNVILFQPTGVGGAKSFTLNSLTITESGAGFSDNLPWVKLGKNAQASYNSVAIGLRANYAANYRDGVVIGTDAASDQQGAVVIGANANGMHNPAYGAASGSDLVALGSGAKAYGWRTTALGAFAGAGGQSGTAIGAGAFAGCSHCVAVGKGAFVLGFPAFGTGNHYTGSVLTSENSQIYFGNGWAHRFPDHPVNNVEFPTNDESYWPAYRKVVLHGTDAFDARPTPGSFNVAGGDIVLMAGRGTGTANGGRVQLMTAPPASGTAPNEKKPAALGLEIDDSTTPADGTRLLLLDIQTNTLKRVKLTAADGNGRKLLYVDN
ncbi:MAG: hypothetical protein U0X91_30980 [Spirosomataceae bacterium]